MKNIKRMLPMLLALLMIAGTAGALGLFSGRQAGDMIQVTPEEYALIEKYQALDEILSVVDRTFLWDYDVSEMMEGAAQGMLGALDDDYTFYYTPDEMEKETEALLGEYGGLGIEVFANAKDNTITIKRVFYGGPAQKAGLRPTDKIIRVEGEEVDALDINYAVSKMRGEIGGEVEVTILREQEIFDVKMVREMVQTQIINYEILDGGIGYVRVHYFEGRLMEQFEQAAEEMKAQGVAGLIIDLRENPGGLMDLALDFADFFLVEDQIILRTEDKYNRQRSLYAEGDGWDIPVVVVQDQYSASASEIVAVALQENDRAQVVGMQSFGKGIMQSMISIGNKGAGMQVTTDYWLSPKGNNLHEVGVTPDLEVELAEDAIDDNYQFVFEKDNQLQAAIELLEETIQQRQPAA